MKNGTKTAATTLKIHWSVAECRDKGSLAPLHSFQIVLSRAYSMSTRRTPKQAVCYEEK